ncbi:MAG: transposase [Sedimentisphaerales bacterium]
MSDSFSSKIPKRDSDNINPQAGLGAKRLHIGRIGDTISLMGKMVGYMVTWTTYGTWLQGDKRGYVQDGKILQADTGLEKANKKLQRSETIRLTLEQKKVVEDAVLKEAERIGQEILALAVCSNHIHLVVSSGNESIENTVSRYKNVATSALKKTGLTKRIWTRGFDKRFCFSGEQLEQKIEYVRLHGKTG